MDSRHIYLSPPTIGSTEKEAIASLMDTGWVAPAGPILTRFEEKLIERLKVPHVLALNSGTSALHLAVKLAGINRGDRVLVSTLTFVAAANAVLYEGGIPVFIDSESVTWNLDPELLRNYLSKSSQKLKALILTHIYGKPAQMDQISIICKQYGLVLIEDAAEAVGTCYQSRSVGGFGEFGVLSFNGNKIITTGGGGALICAREVDHNKALHLAQQAKDAAGYYAHSEVGYNYRLSGPLAAIGYAQLDRLDDFLQKKRRIRDKYYSELVGILEFPEIIQGENHWLTVGMVPKGVSYHPKNLIEFLAKKSIEARRVWKPLHLQPLFKDAEFVGNGVSEDLFSRGICLPSGTGLTDEDQGRVIESILNAIP